MKWTASSLRQFLEIRDLGNNNVCAAEFQCEEPGLALSDC
jgi:hypothetical protein